MFDEYDEFEYEDEAYYRKQEPVYTEEEIDSKLKELKEKRKQLRKKKRAQTLATICVLGGMGVAPTIISAITGMQMGRSPFTKDDVTRVAHVKTEFNSDGEVKTSKHYVPYEGENSEIKYYSDWVKSGNKYVACETTYDVTGLTYDDVEGFIKIKGIESEPFGKPVAERIITKENVSKEELAKGSHYEGVIYQINNDDTIITPQTESENKDDVVGFIVIPLLAGVAAVGIGKLMLITEESMTNERADNSYELSKVNKEVKDFEEKKKKLVKKLK